jgi:hypothetical protein
VIISGAGQARGISFAATDLQRHGAGSAPLWRPHFLTLVRPTKPLKEIVISQQVVEGTAGPLCTPAARGLNAGYDRMDER